MLEDVVIGLLLVEGKRLFKARAATPTHVDSKDLIVLLLAGEQLVQLAGRRVGECHCFVRRIHASYCIGVYGARKRLTGHGRRMPTPGTR